MNNINDIKEKIRALPDDWHTAGPLSPKVIEAIVKHSRGLQPIEFTVETGAGKSTLLFSHLSRHHVCFALALRNRSILAVKESELFNAPAVAFVEGPTQKTLPAYSFSKNIQIALIDGPHGYPFPDLEYFYFYPHIVEGGLLIIDDVQIPTIKRMFDIIKADDMFKLIEVCGETAFFKRTNAPVLDPYGDGWWLQGYNRKHFLTTSRETRIAVGLKRIIPPAVRQKTPYIIKEWMKRLP